jgi:hypothetical protein
MNAFPKGALAAFFLSSLLLFLPPAVQGQKRGYGSRFLIC